MDTRTEVENGHRHLTDGPGRAPHRSRLGAPGRFDAGLHRPLPEGGQATRADTVFETSGGGLRCARPSRSFISALTVRRKPRGGPVGHSDGPLPDGGSALSDGVRSPPVEVGTQSVGTHAVDKTSDANLAGLTASGRAGAEAASDITRHHAADMNAGVALQLIATHLRPRDIVTRCSSQTDGAASGGLVTAAAHAPAIAHAAGITRVGVFKKTPCAVDLKPAGRDVAKDMLEYSSIPLLMTTLFDLGHLHGGCPPVAGRAIAANKSVTSQSAPRRGAAER